MGLAVDGRDDHAGGPGHPPQLGEPCVLVVGRQVREDADHDHEVEGAVVERQRREPRRHAHVDPRRVLGQPGDRLLVDVGRGHARLGQLLVKRARQPARA